jgi:hypothetical protein
VSGTFGTDETPGPEAFPLQALISSAGTAAMARVARMFLIILLFLYVECLQVTGMVGI